MGNPWGKWFWSDWLADPGLRRSSYAARGLWMDMLCIAAEADPIGTLVVNGEPLSTGDIARMTGGDPSEVATLLIELDRNGVLSRDRTGRIYNRRMVREGKRLKASAKGGKIGGRVTYENHSGIFSTQATTQDATQGTTRDPEARSQKPQERELSRTIERWFALFWQAYPNRGKAANPRKPALDRFRRVIAAGADPEAIIAGARRFATTRNGEDPKFTPQATRWLNEERWNDGAPQTNGYANGPAPPRDEADAARRLEVGRLRRMWPRPRWGPMPNEDGCTVPPHLIKPEDGVAWDEWEAGRS